MATALVRSNDISESSPSEFKEKMNPSAQKGGNDGMSDSADSFLLTLLNFTVCSNCPPFISILGQNGFSLEEEGTPDEITSLTDSFGEEILSCHKTDTGKNNDTAKLMNMKILRSDVPVKNSDKINEENLKNIKLINECSRDATVKSYIENVDWTLVNMNNEDRNEIAKSKGVINDMPKMETVNKTLISFTKETGDNLKIFIDPVKYQSAVKIDKRINDQPERHPQDSATRSVVGEIQGGKIDEHSNISGESTPRNENRENAKMVIDGYNYQFSRKDQKIPGGESKKPVEFVAARTGEVLSQSENSKGNNNVEGSNAAGGSINDLEKYNLEVEKTWVTVNNQKSSNESNRESTSPKNQQENLSDKTIENINKAEAEKFAGNSDKDGSTKKNNYEKNEKPLKGSEFAETVKINKTTGETTHEYTITNISNKKALPVANIHFSNDQKNEIDKTIESQLVASRQSDIKNSEISTQTKTFSKDDRYLQSSILSQLIDKTSVSPKNGLSSMEIRLKPETLGSLKMLVSNENNQVSIKIVTEGQLVKEIIENNILQLRNELHSQGMELAKIEVVADHDPSNNRANYGHSKSALLANKKDNESQQDNMEKLDMDHEDDSNEGRISFFA